MAEEPFIETKMQLVSVIVPVFNEADCLPLFHEALSKVLTGLPQQFEIIFIDDGSDDGSVACLRLLEKTDPRVNVIRLSRNFGKEVAITAGLNHCQGDAAIIIDADLQHPVELIPEFIDRWQNGGEVIVGVRRRYEGESLAKRLNSWLFYKILNSMTNTKTVPSSTDYRLLDRIVIDQFNRFSERNRMTRGLIDWLGFNREYIYFDASKRVGGKAAYSFMKLVRLALNSFVSLSLFPLRVAGYLGIAITSFAAVTGVFILIEKYMLHDPLRLHISGTASLATVNMMLIGIVLTSLGLIALYIANIHSEVTSRPLYVVRRDRPKLQAPILVKSKKTAAR